jgi:phosphatidylglycerol---prolipoprotein diacylglyceryl transferase
LNRCDKFLDQRIFQTKSGSIASPKSENFYIQLVFSPKPLNNPLMTNSVWVHNLDPFVFKFTEHFGIRWYSLAYLTGFACTFLFMSWMVKKKRTTLTLEMASDYLTFLILGVLLGGRIGYTVFYSPELLTDFRSKFPFWGALAVWEGGMASHGGFIGVFIAIFYFSWKNKQDKFHLGDLTIVGVTIGIFLGRIANFINGELMGKVAPPNLPWAVKFPQDIYRWVDWEPEKLPSLSKTVQLLGISESEWGRWVANRSTGALNQTMERIVAAIQNGNETVRQTLGMVLEPRHPSQLYGALGEGLIPLLILLFVWQKPRKPGLICGLYLIIYSCFRVLDEMYRLPDAHLADLSKLALGISRGQFLSLFIFAFGLGVVFFALKRQSPLMGGIFEGAAIPTPRKKTKSKK